MNANERIQAVERFGFTTRQAGFLVAVMTHSGVCLPREYATFAGVAYGHKVNRFFDRLVARRFASACPSLHNRAVVYHVRHRGLYQAIGEPHSRFRRPVPAIAAGPRLMVLDAVIGALEVRWLPTAREKAEHFTERLGVPVECLPSRVPRKGDGSSRWLFPDALPVGIEGGERTVIVFPATAVTLQDFAPFLRRHRALLASLAAWTFRLVTSPEGEPAQSSWQAVIRREIGSLLDLVYHGERRVDWHVLSHRYGHLSPLVDQFHRVRLHVHVSDPLPEPLFVSRPRPRGRSRPACRWSPPRKEPRFLCRSATRGRRRRGFANPNGGDGSLQ